MSAVRQNNNNSRDKISLLFIISCAYIYVCTRVYSVRATTFYYLFCLDRSPSAVSQPGVDHGPRQLAFSPYVG